METENKNKPVYCSLCQHSILNGPYWNPEFEEDDYSVYCTKLKKVVHEDLHWTECARTTSSRAGFDRADSSCPLNNNN